MMALRTRPAVKKIWLRHCICIQQPNNNDKPVGDWISAPSPNVVAMATGRPHNIVYGSTESAIPENPLLGRNISGLPYKPTYRRSCANFGE